MNWHMLTDSCRKSISPTIGSEELKKRNLLEQVNTALLKTDVLPTFETPEPASANALATTLNAVEVIRVKDAQMDEMWSFLGSKKQDRWL